MYIINLLSFHVFAGTEYIHHRHHRGGPPRINPPKFARITMYRYATQTGLRKELHGYGAATLKFRVTELLEFSSDKYFKLFNKDVAYLPRPSST
jgi:hypothetical protein